MFDVLQWALVLLMVYVLGQRLSTGPGTVSAALVAATPDPEATPSTAAGIPTPVPTGRHVRVRVDDRLVELIEVTLDGRAHTLLRRIDAHGQPMSAARSAPEALDRTVDRLLQKAP
jgi:hypothetical protein